MGLFVKGYTHAKGDGYTTAMTFRTFASEYLQPLEQTSKKLEQTALLARFFEDMKGEADSLPPYIYLILGQTGPIFANKQYFFGLEFMLYALALVAPSPQGEALDLFGNETQSYELRKKALKARYKQLGDIGLLAEEVLQHASGEELSVESMYDSLITLTSIGGEGSQEFKIEHVAGIFRKLDSLSARYVARMIMGQLRLGFSDKTILDALSWYVSGDKSQREELDDIYQRHPDIGVIARDVVLGGMEAAKKLDAELGVPIVPALCDRLKSAQEVIDKMGEVFVDPKYDGTRLQMHWNAATKTLRTFTRNLEESTHMFPELAGLLSELSVDSIILDGEAVGYDPTTKELVTFQQTIKRKRKHDIEETMAAIPLRFFVFDLLLLNGESYLHVPLEQRRQKLKELLPADLPDLVLSPTIRTSSPEELRAFHKEQLGKGLEGVVIKKVGGSYQSGRKAFNWVKFKEEEGNTAKLNDTIDAVVLGFYYGRGKRTAFGIGAFLIGIYDEAADQLQTLAKVGTGLSDDQWRELRQRCDELQSRSGSGEKWSVSVPDLLMPDVMLPPEIVVEVAADEITQSPLHSAGVALRFPRLVRFRDDKSVRDITTKTEISQIRVGSGVV